MKLSTTLVVLSAILALGTGSTLLAGGSATKETLLAQSGFRLKTVTTQRQREQIDGLPEGQVSAIMYQHKLYYVYRTSSNSSNSMPTSRHLAGQRTRAGFKKRCRIVPIWFLKVPDLITCEFRSSTDSDR